MMLSINNTIKPNFTELAESIAHELELNISQVWLSYFIFDLASCQKSSSS